MDLITWALALGLLTVVQAAGFLAWRLRRERQAYSAALAAHEKRAAEQLAAAEKAPAPTHDAKRVLAALASSSAIVRIDVLDPGDFFIRSPRG